MKDGRIYITYDNIHKTVRRLAELVRNDGYTPDIIVAIGSGGLIPARILRTYLGMPILTVGIAYYDMQNRPTENPRKIQWIDEVEQKLKGKRLLLVDEVDDTRVTLEYCLRELQRHDPAEIAVAVLHNKQKTKSGSFPAEVDRYYAGKEFDDVWITYPWDAEDIDEHNVRAG
jgi:uncharacterized protein